VSEEPTRNTKLPSRADEIREAAEADLESFIRLVSPKQVLGSIHQEICGWWTREDAKTHQILLMPRDHGKSRLIAYRVAWMVTKQPDIRILYISATSNLAEKQLKFIKDILTSSVYKKYWPDMIHDREGDREKWTQTEISVDHPKRKEEAVRDPTIFTGGLTTSLTGLHCDVAVMDDVVVFENAYTEIGRDAVSTQYSLLTSIMGTDERAWVVGTRYHPKDLYSELLEASEDIYDDEGEVVDQEPIYEVFERAVEDRGDGTGEFLWPRQQRSDGKWFGFDRQILARKRGQYINKTQFRAQYYNDPNDMGDLRIDRGKFQYYDQKFLTHENGGWFYRDRRLNVFASVDFAYSTSARADFTAIAVVGMDRDGFVYVLEIDRFKTDKISEYFQHILELQTKWDFRKLNAETTAAQVAIVRELKDLIRRNGMYLSIVEHKPNARQGSKEERLMAILEPKYSNQSVWHYRGGNCQVLEDELIMTHPPHDDCMDALASAIDICIPPTGMLGRDHARASNVVTHRKFGGIQFG
jgi:phage terminase large subunit-like protein